MRFVDEKAIAGIKPIQVFRESLAVHFFWPIALFAAASGIMAAIGAGALEPAMGFLAALLGGIGLVTAVANLPLLRATNWLALTTDEGVYIKLRSYLNRHIRDDAPTIFFVPADEIAGARAVTEKRIEHFPPARRNHSQLRHIDIVLQPGADTSAVAEAVAAERASQPAAGVLFGEKLAAYPVAVPEPGVVRMEWRSRDSAVAPGLGRALAILGRFGPTLEPLTVHVDYANKAHHDELDALLDVYIREGKTARAVRIAQERYGLGAAEAVLLVEERSRKYRGAR